MESNELTPLQRQQLASFWSYIDYLSKARKWGTTDAVLANTARQVGCLYENLKPVLEVGTADRKL